MGNFPGAGAGVENMGAGSGSKTLLRKWQNIWGKSVKISKVSALLPPSRDKIAFIQACLLRLGVLSDVPKI